MSSPARTVAIVDDDPRILESLQELLESAGYRVAAFASGGALLASGVKAIDCLITDIRMPGMDGFELRDRLKQLRPELPVFFISGRRELADHEPSSRDCDGFFRKPFDGTALLSALELALHGGLER
jgi:FixJ family two-component response regulator